MRARGALFCLIGRPVVMHCDLIGGIEFAAGTTRLVMSECIISGTGDARAAVTFDTGMFQKPGPR